MKELTDEEIEKYANREMYYSGDPKVCAIAKMAIIDGAKFARDHSPKFKTLSDILYSTQATAQEKIAELKKHIHHEEKL